MFSHRVDESGPDSNVHDDEVADEEAGDGEVVASPVDRSDIHVGYSEYDEDGVATGIVPMARIGAVGTASDGSAADGGATDGAVSDGVDGQVNGEAAPDGHLNGSAPAGSALVGSALDEDTDEHPIIRLAVPGDQVDDSTQDSDRDMSDADLSVIESDPEPDLEPSAVEAEADSAVSEPEASDSTDAELLTDVRVAGGCRAGRGR